MRHSELAAAPRQNSSLYGLDAAHPNTDTGRARRHIAHVQRICNASYASSTGATTTDAFNTDTTNASTPRRHHPRRHTDPNNARLTPQSHHHHRLQH